VGQGSDLGNFLIDSEGIPRLPVDHAAMEPSELEHLSPQTAAPQAPPAVPRRRLPALPGGRRATAAAAVIGALVVGGIGAAVAQTGGSTSTTQPPANGAPALPGGPGGGPDGGPGRAGGMRGPGGFGHKGAMGGPMGAIHGEFVVPNGSGGYRTIDTQRGQVTSVSSDSITVKSADNFSKTYGVDKNTVVDSGRDGIANVKNGDTVLVTAGVDSGNASAMSINDATTLGAIRQHWNPNSQSPPTSTPSTSTPST
jgi:hypothetical protein